MLSHAKIAIVLINALESTYCSILIAYFFRKQRASTYHHTFFPLPINDYAGSCHKLQVQYLFLCKLAKSEWLKSSYTRMKPQVFAGGSPFHRPLIRGNDYGHLRTTATQESWQPQLDKRLLSKRWSIKFCVSFPQWPFRIEVTRTGERTPLCCFQPRFSAKMFHWFPLQICEPIAQSN